MMIMKTKCIFFRSLSKINLEFFLESPIYLDPGTFNIESITVGITEKPDLSRMTITTVSDVKTLEQLVKAITKVD